MNKYAGLDHLGFAFVTRIREAVAKEEGVEAEIGGYGSQDSGFTCKLLTAGTRYTFQWCQPHDSNIVTLHLLEASLRRGEKVVTIAAPFEAPKGPLRRVLEAVSSFQGMFEIRGQTYTFYGFGAGLDPEQHRKICELVGVEGRLWRMGTSLDLGELRVFVPHPYFQEMGERLMVVSSEFADRPTDPAFDSVDSFRAYLEKLRRHSATLELLERTFGV